MVRIKYILVLLLFLSLNLFATTIRYVSSSTGNDGNNGETPATAWATIDYTQDAGNGLASGDVIIYIDAGTYLENVVIDNYGGSGEDFFQYVGSPEKFGNTGKIIMDGENSGRGFIVILPTTSYQNIHLKNYFDGGISYAGTSNNTIIKNCIAENNGQGFVTRGYAKFINCMAFNNSSIGFVLNHIQLAAKPVEVLNCVIYNNASVNGGIRLHNTGTAVIKNCIIIDNDMGIKLINGAAIEVSDFNNFYNNTTVVDDNGATYATLALWQVTGQDINSIDSDPLLINPPSDYHYFSNSPCIDRGTAVSVLNGKDGIPRPKNYRYDIGAYEYDRVMISGD